MVFDESSFDARAIPGVKVPPGYGAHFKSSDGKQRSLLVEGAGGPSWYTEYNVLTGLSARSYGRFADFVTRIAAGRVERGLPQTLKTLWLQDLHVLSDVRRVPRCAQLPADGGYPALPRLGGARRELPRPGLVLFQQGGRYARPRSAASKSRCSCWSTPRRTTSPGDFRFRPELAPEWKDLGNSPDVDEYLRRQHLSALDYQAFDRAAAQGVPGRVLPDRALRRPPALLRAQHDRSGAGRHDAGAQDRGGRSALPANLLRHQHHQLHGARHCPRP